ncbi:MAG: ABC transporter permease [Candidatus Lokiarchaeota archaeon]|nr:ABC transporter permease [Candidatus Lokiarchaeota archaeon]
MFASTIARRFLSANKKQTFFIIFGIALGVAVQIFVGSLIGGLQQTLLDRTIGNSPHIVISSTSDNPQISNWTGPVQSIRGISGVSTVATVQDGQAFVTNFTKDALVLLRGFDITEANKIYGFLDKIYEGRAPASVNETIVGKEMQKQHDLELGDTLELQINLANPFDTRNVTIVGFYDLGVAAVNKLWVITKKQTTTGVFGYGTNITSINIQVADPFEAKTIATSIKALIARPDLDVVAWQEQNAQLLSGFQAQSISTYMIQAFVLISVVLGISSTLAITVVQKSRQLGILKAMGTNDKQASNIFILEGAIFGIGGTSLGILLGIFMFWGFAANVKDSATGGPLIYFVLDWNLILISAVVAIIACVIAAASPALRASKLSVIEVIRNG